MKQTKTFTAENLDIALTLASEDLDIPKEYIEYTIRKDAKSGVFGIIPRRDIEIEVLITGSSKKEKTVSRSKNLAKKGKQSFEEELIPFAELSTSDKEITLAIIQEVITKIVTIVSHNSSIQVITQEASIDVIIEENEDTKVLIGKDMEVLKAIQYIIYKIVTQHVRCLFSLHIFLGDAVVSEETLLISMLTKLIEKVKTTQKTQRTYPLNPQQRALVSTIVKQEKDVIIKKQKTELPLQPVILLYSANDVE